MVFRICRLRPRFFCTCGGRRVCRCRNSTGRFRFLAGSPRFQSDLRSRTLGSFGHVNHHEHGAGR